MTNYRIFAPVCCLAALLSACDKRTPTTPDLTGSPTGAGQPIALSLELLGPATIPPGETAQFKVVEHLSDGTTLDLTTSAKWSVSGSALAVEGGLVTARTAGEGTLTAALTLPTRYLSATKGIIAVPAGTYRLIGQVTELPVPGGPVVGARVEVTSGSGRGLLAITGDDGRYRLYGVGAETTVRISKDGYVPQDRDVLVTDHQQLDAALALEQQRPGIEGKYLLTIAAASECRTKLPEEARSRTYAADISQLGNQLTAKLSGGSFVLSRAGAGSRFTGRLEPSGIVFSLTDMDWYYYGFGGPYGDIVEQLNPMTQLLVQGKVAVPLPPATAGTLDGSIIVYSGDDVRSGSRRGTSIWCTSKTHRFSLVPGGF
jgi:hypothetical protein